MVSYRSTSTQTVGQNLLDELLMKGKYYTRQTYLPWFESIPHQTESLYYPIMIPPAPLSRFVDKLDKEGFAEMNKLRKSDKRTYDLRKNLRIDAREGYEAEVCVYRAIERLKLTQKVIVLHSLKYLQSDFQFFTGEEKEGECDILVIGENFFVIIEVKKNPTDQKKGKEQALRTKKLIEGIFKKISQTATPFIMHHVAFPFTTKKGRAPDAACIYKEDLMGDGFGKWWKTNIHINNDQQFHDLYEQTKDVLIALWATNINDKNRDFESFRCSLGWNIMDIDEKLKKGHITFIPRGGIDPKTSNPSVKEAPEEIRDYLEVEYITTEQHDAFERIKSGKSWLIQGPAGSGKTLLLAGRVVQFAKSEPDKKILIISSAHPLRFSTTVYQVACKNAGIDHRIRTFTVRDLLQLEEQILKIGSENNSETIYFYDGDKDIFTKKFEKNIKLMAIHFDLIVIDDSQCNIAHLKREHYRLGFDCMGNALQPLFDFIIEKPNYLPGTADGVQCLINAAFVPDIFNTLISNSKIPGGKQILVAMDVMQLLALETCSYNYSCLAKIRPSILLTRNLRNTCDISDIVSCMRNEFFYFGVQKQDSGHFLRGPLLKFHLFEKFKLRKIQEVLNYEMFRIKSGGFLKRGDVGLISFAARDSYDAGYTLLQGLRLSDWNVFWVNIRDCYSLEFPAVVVLLESRSLIGGDKSLSSTFMETLCNRLYSSISRARVLCTVLLFPEEPIGDKSVFNDNDALTDELYRTYNYHLDHFAKKFEPFAQVIRH